MGSQRFACRSLRSRNYLAERVGYSDLVYFSNAYKRVTGMTPTEYRRNSGSVSL
ncbi:helix-turn-helix domain-containing protein [Paenibacillus rubinfantis]|uniref:helix-turn-helix domain-containing protein n=1 Tax=Paenibacillus rubinfantis TaxID=1720296 RepID=UPI003709C458